MLAHLDVGIKIKVLGVVQKILPNHAVVDEGRTLAVLEREIRNLHNLLRQIGSAIKAFRFGTLLSLSL
jgi:hypothetical protein